METQLKNGNHHGPSDHPVNTNQSTVDLVGTYKRVFPLVAKIIKKYGGGEEDAKDVFHDALLIWLEKPVSERNAVANEDAYIIAISRNEWFRRVEKMNRIREANFIVDEEEYRVSGELYNYMVKAGKKCMELLQAFYYEKLDANTIA